MAAPSTTEPYDALLLAGGEGRRMGGVDKGLQPWRGAPLYRHVLDKLQAQTRPPQRILISANRHRAHYGESGCPVLADLRPGHAGPLAGIEAGLAATTAPWLLCVACDTPHLPADLAERLFAAIAGRTEAAYALTEAGPQPTCCLLHRNLLASLRTALDLGQGGVKRWLDSVGAGTAHFANAEAFANYNTLSDLDNPPPIP